jgi:hypothetical protein
MKKSSSASIELSSRQADNCNSRVMASDFSVIKGLRCVKNEVRNLKPFAFLAFPLFLIQKMGKNDLVLVANW